MKIAIYIEFISIVAENKHFSIKIELYSIIIITTIIAGQNFTTITTTIISNLYIVANIIVYNMMLNSYSLLN